MKGPWVAIQRNPTSGTGARRGVLLELIRELKRLQPGVECVGFGGERMEAAGCRLLYPLCRLAVMWILRVLLNAHVFLKLLFQADHYFRDQRPDAVVLIDYPGFNWWIARRAHARGIPVFYFVPPQLWGWAGWRVEPAPDGGMWMATSIDGDKDSVPNNSHNKIFHVSLG